MVLEATNLVKHYGDFAALKGLDLSIDAGEVFGCLANGAGKTTTIRFFSALSSPLWQRQNQGTRSQRQSARDQATPRLYTRECDALPKPHRDREPLLFDACRMRINRRSNIAGKRS